MKYLARQKLVCERINISIVKDPNHVFYRPKAGFGLDEFFVVKSLYTVCIQ